MWAVLWDRVKVCWFSVYVDIHAFTWVHRVCLISKVWPPVHRPQVQTADPVLQIRDHFLGYYVSFDSLALVDTGVLFQSAGYFISMD